MFISYMKSTNSIAHAGQENQPVHKALSEQPMKSFRRETFQLNIEGFAFVKLEPATLWAKCTANLCVQLHQVLTNVRSVTL